MSHFSVLVFGPHPEKQLVPFSRARSVTPYVSMTRELATRNHLHQIHNLEYALDCPDVEKLEQVGRLQEHLELLKGRNEDAIFNDAVHHQDRINEWGEAISTRNPQGHCDSFQEGGRWSPFFVCKNGQECNSTLVEDIDLARMRSGVLSTANEAWECYLKEHPADRRIYTSKEKFVESLLESHMVPFAYIHDNAWYAKGKLKTFGPYHPHPSEVSWAERFWQFWASLPGSTLVTMMDCHT